MVAEDRRLSSKIVERCWNRRESTVVVANRRETSAIVKGRRESSRTVANRLRIVAPLRRYQKHLKSPTSAEDRREPLGFVNNRRQSWKLWMIVGNRRESSTIVENILQSLETNNNRRWSRRIVGCRRESSRVIGIVENRRSWLRIVEKRQQS